MAKKRSYDELKQKIEDLENEVRKYENSEKELRRSRDFMENVLNSLDDPVFVKDENHRWVLLNNAISEISCTPPAPRIFLLKRVDTL